MKLTKDIQANEVGSIPDSGTRPARAGLAALAEDAQTITAYLTLSIFIIRVVMCYIIRCNSALLGNMRRIEYAVIFLWATGCIIHVVTTLLSGDGTRKKELIRSLKAAASPEQLILVGILIWGIISCISMGAAYEGNWVSTNQYVMEDIAISVLIFFPMTMFFEKEDLKKLLFFCVHVMMLVITVLMAVVLWNMFQGKTIRVPDGIIMMRNGRLYINVHYNTAGAYAAFSAPACIVMATSEKRRWSKLFYISAFLIHWTILSLTQSITALVVGSFSVGALTALILIYSNKAKPSLRRVLIASICGTAVLVIMWLSRQWIVLLYKACLPIDVVSDSGTAIGATANSTANVTVRDMSNYTTFNARVQLWKASIKAIMGNNGSESTFRNSLFGYTFSGVIPVLKVLSGRGGGEYTHNQFLEMGVAMGIPAMLAYIAFTVIEAIVCLRIGLADRGRVTLAERMVPLLVLSLVIANLTEAMLMGNVYMPGCFFFILCGWCSRKGRELGRPEWINAKLHKKE